MRFTDPPTPRLRRWKNNPLTAMDATNFLHEASAVDAGIPELHLLSEPWQEHHDPEHNKAFYFNPSTQETIWDRPQVEIDGIAHTWTEGGLAASELYRTEKPETH